MNDHDAPTRELFGTLARPQGLLRDELMWCATEHLPMLHVGDVWLLLPTIAHLRAACLLLGIPWPAQPH